MKTRQAVRFLYHPGSSTTAACSVQMWEQISKVITRAITVAKNTGVTWERVSKERLLDMGLSLPSSPTAQPVSIGTAPSSSSPSQKLSPRRGMSLLGPDPKLGWKHKGF